MSRHQGSDPLRTRSWGADDRRIFVGILYARSGAYSECFGTRTIADQRMSRDDRKDGPDRTEQGGKTWGQLYAAMALQSFGTDLNRNACAGLDFRERQSYRPCSTPALFMMKRLTR